ncbi:MAG: hypothetical protein LBF85_08460, partial [Tannerella sp.]|nr:hypothetical protein [Tannerella sp.]
MRTLLIMMTAALLTGCAAGERSRLCETYAPDAEERATWDRLLEQGVEKIVFVKRYTYNANHYYTESLNSRWMPGGNLCILSLKNGEVEELVPSLEGGV